MLFGRDVYEFFSAARSNTMIGSGTYMQFAFPLILVVFFLILIRRFVGAVQESEQLNRELEQRVAAIDTQLQASCAANRTWELKEATEQQKQKIYRDLHHAHKRKRRAVEAGAVRTGLVARDGIEWQFPGRKTGGHADRCRSQHRGALP